MQGVAWRVMMAGAPGALVLKDAPSPVFPAANSCTSDCNFSRRDRLSSQFTICI